MTIGQYAKSLVWLLASALVVLSTALTDGKVTTVEALQVLSAVLTAVAVYMVPNLESGVRAYAKGIAAFLGAAVGALITVVGSGGLSEVTPASWTIVMLAALGAIGVVVTPNPQPQPAAPGAVVQIGAPPMQMTSGQAVPAEPVATTSPFTERHVTGYSATLRE